MEIHRESPSTLYFDPPAAEQPAAAQPSSPTRQGEPSAAPITSVAGHAAGLPSKDAYVNNCLHDAAIRHAATCLGVKSKADYLDNFCKETLQTLLHDSARKSWEDVANMYIDDFLNSDIYSDAREQKSEEAAAEWSVLNNMAPAFQEPPTLAAYVDSALHDAAVEHAVKSMGMDTDEYVEYSVSVVLNQLEDPSSNVSQEISIEAIHQGLHYDAEKSWEKDAEPHISDWMTSDAHADARTRTQHDAERSWDAQSEKGNAPPSPHSVAPQPNVRSAELRVRNTHAAGQATRSAGNDVVGRRQDQIGEAEAPQEQNEAQSAQGETYVTGGSGNRYVHADVADPGTGTIHNLKISIRQHGEKRARERLEAARAKILAGKGKQPVGPPVSQEDWNAFKATRDATHIDFAASRQYLRLRLKDADGEYQRTFTVTGGLQKAFDKAVATRANPPPRDRPVAQVKKVTKEEWEALKKSRPKEETAWIDFTEGRQRLRVRLGDTTQENYKKVDVYEHLVPINGNLENALKEAIKIRKNPPPRPERAPKGKSVTEKVKLEEWKALKASLPAAMTKAISFSSERQQLQFQNLTFRLNGDLRAALNQAVAARDTPSPAPVENSPRPEQPASPKE